MFRTTFNNVIADSGSLFYLLTKHVAGPAKEAIMPYVYSENRTNGYKEAKNILRDWYGSQNSVINAHKKILMGCKEVSDTIADFERLANELKSFSSVLKHYQVTSEYFSGEVVTDILERRISKFSSRSTSRNWLGGKPTFPFAETSNNDHFNEVVNSHQSTTDSDDNLSVSSVDEEGGAEVKVGDVKPSTSQDSAKTEHSPLLDSIVEIWD